MKYDGKFASRWRAKSPDALCAVLPLICCGANLFYEPQELCLSGIGAFENTCVQQNLFKDCPDFLLNLVLPKNMEAEKVTEQKKEKA